MSISSRAKQTERERRYSRRPSKPAIRAMVQQALKEIAQKHKSTESLAQNNTP